MPTEMNPFRRLRDDKYRAFDEPVIRLRKHHPMAAVVPFVPPVLLFVFWIGALADADSLWWVVLALLVHQVIDLARRVPVLGSMGLARTAAVAISVALVVAWMAPFFGFDFRNRVVGIIFTIGLLRGLYLLIEYFTIRLYLTDRRILRVSGLINRKAATLPLRMLTDVGFEETWLGAILRYGHFDVESAGQDQALSSLRFVEDHWDFYQTIMALAPPGIAIPERLREDRATARLARRWGISLDPPGLEQP